MSLAEAGLEIPREQPSCSLQTSRARGEQGSTKAEKSQRCARPQSEEWRQEKRAWGDPRTLSLRKRRPARGSSLTNCCATRVHTRINWPRRDLRGH
ncbi:hypothetical protein E2C01_042153 [Portunus trituberculatus]|uniref:Uncharacterized protein n=1 Tax=Portunus trituberculatus TaxID=210409 RepID=A0A5B7FTV2_PORTR|nr:hypothetical protein [Portunus trituberculatus]